MLYIMVVVSYIEVQILKYRQESGHKYVVQSPIVSCLRQCKQGAGNECPAWSPSSSHLRKREQEAVVNV